MLCRAAACAHSLDMAGLVAALAATHNDRQDVIQVAVSPPPLQRKGDYMDARIRSIIERFTVADIVEALHEAGHTIHQHEITSAVKVDSGSLYHIHVNQQLMIVSIGLNANGDFIGTIRNPS